MTKKQWVGTEVPGWLRTIIATYSDLMQDYFNIDIDFTPQQLYGCGHFGCVFATEAPEWVLKITRDPTEGPVVKYISSLEDDYDAFVVYHPTGILRLEDVNFRGCDWPVYVYLRENVLPIADLYSYSTKFDDLIYQTYNKNTGDFLLRELKNGLGALNGVVVAARDLRHTLNLKRKDHFRHRNAEDKYIEGISTLFNYQPFYWIAFAMDFLYNQHDIILTDVHINNVGVSQYYIGHRNEATYYPDFGHVRIFDPGHTQLPEPIEIPKLV